MRHGVAPLASGAAAVRCAIAVATLIAMGGRWQAALRKVCGVTRPADAMHAVEAGANAIGMIFYAPSPRSVTLARARQVGSCIPDHVRRVGVFVSERPDFIAAAIDQARINVVQLHGNETAEECDTVRRELGNEVEIWKAIRVGAGFRGTGLAKYGVDAFLLDTAKKGAYGGTGEAFPWKLALLAKRFGRIVLAGGLDGGNVGEAVRTVRPWGVDSSSRLEERPGVKDPSKVTRFLAALR